MGYGYQTSALPSSVRPFVELQHGYVSPDRGSISPQALFGRRNVVSLSVGVRLFFGGGPTRMGSYGLLDLMAAGMRPAAAPSDAPHGTSH